jgi:hypothetical protein
MPNSIVLGICIFSRRDAQAQKHKLLIFSASLRLCARLSFGARPEGATLNR